MTDEDANEDPNNVKLVAADLLVGRKRDRRRKTPNITRMIVQAEKAGRKVTTVTRDGVTLGLGEPAAPAADFNEWDAEWPNGKH